jgi:hypothetical protein
MSAYIRRFNFDPGNAVLLNIESINVLDLDPPAALQGIGSGTVTCVGEYEDGPYNFPLEVDTADNLMRQMGALGYTIGGVQANNASAIARKADGAGAPEYWNGNAVVQLNGKQFSRLIVTRANTSVGSIQLTPLPSVTSATSQLTYSLATGQVLSLDVGAGAQSATFTGAVATTTGSGAAFGSIAVGNQITLAVDGKASFTVTFQAGDTTIANVVARINQFAGFTFASNAAGQLALSGVQAGTGGQVQVVSDNTSGTTITHLGLTVGTTLGTGNVLNIAAVQQSEVAAVIQAAVANTLVQIDSLSRIRISNTSPGTAPYVQINAALTTALGLGFQIPIGGPPQAAIPGQTIGTQQNQAIVVSSNQTYTLATNDTVTLGFDAYPNVIVTFQSTDNTAALIVTRINLAFTAAGLPNIAFADGSSRIYLTSALQQTTASNVRVVGASSGAVLVKLGLVVGTVTSLGPIIGQVPAGTVVQVPGASQTNVFVTTQTVYFNVSGVLIGGISTAGGGVTVTQTGPYIVPIRHALDDGSGLSATAGAITQFANYPPDVFSFSITNLSPTTAALTETQIDAAYVTALASTVDVNSIAKQTNIIFSARQSNTIRSALRTNAIQASANGCYGRVACVRPPLNTDRYTAVSLVAPGAGATSDQRTIFCYIGSNVFVPVIGTRGIAGNPVGTSYTAFTVDGNVDVGSDSLMASILSQLPPEENPGQDTAFASVVNGIEKGANVQGFQMSDYINFKAAGIAALRVDDGQVSFQSGVTSVNPQLYPQLAPIARRRMADYIQDSLAIAGKPFSKKINTFVRRKAYASEVRAFLDGLLSEKNPQFQRIAGYTLDSKTANTQATLAAGMFRLRIRVQTLSSLDSIVLETTIGNNVNTVQQVLPQAA